jgi:methylmalonyl-CoA mutase
VTTSSYDVPNSGPGGVRFLTHRVGSVLGIVRRMTDPSPTDELALVSAEDAHTQADWEKIAAAVLRKSGKLTDEDPDSAVWQALTRTTLDGIPVLPVGVPGVEASPVRPARANAWDIRPVLEVADPRTANESALADLENGATSLWLQLTPDSDIAATLEGVLLDLAPVVLDGPAWPLSAARSLVALLKAQGITPADGTNLGADPIGALVRGIDDTGNLVTVARLAVEAGTLALVVDGTAVHDLGASDAQELGYSLAVGATYLRVLTDAGMGIDDALGLMEFRYAATDEQFPTIAKFRAARLLWARVAELSQGKATGQRQHAVTSRPMMSAYDPWVNMLRTTVAAFAAGVGGADAVTVLPFDSRLGVPDAVGRRNARSTSSLLISESHVAKVSDPGGGSYAVEKLTDDLARAGWAEFGRIEESGGIHAALEEGSLRARIDEMVAVRDAEIARRTRPLTGVSEFPNLGETLPVRAPHPVESTVRPYGAAFEALRDTPAANPVFLATMGSVAAHTARATFASNLFAAGGVAVESAGATATTADVLKTYAGQPVVCLAGTDAAYAEWGADLVAALREAGARWVILAGKRNHIEVDDSCAVGVDALAFLNRTREKLA